MLFLTILALGLVLCVAHLAERNLLFPPELLASTWLISLAAAFLSQSSFFPIEPEACAVYILGTTAFVLGGVGAAALIPPGSASLSSLAPTRWTHVALDILLAVLVVGLPFYWRSLSGTVDDVQTEVTLHAIRVAQLDRVDEASSFSPILNLGVLSQFVAIAMFHEATGSRSHRWRAAVAILVALIYGAMGGAKANSVVLLLTLAFVSSIRARRIRLGALAISALGALALFSLGLLLVNFAFTGFADPSEMLSSLAESVQMYWIGGLIAFGAIAVNPDAIASTQPIDRFVLETARSLGFSIDVPPMHAEYLNISTFTETNTYTIYFSYFKDHGWVGTLVIMLALGALMTYIYRVAMRDQPIAVLTLAKLSVAVVLSLHAEHFFNDINGLTKYLLFLLLLYYLLPAMERRRTLLASHA